MKHAAFKISVLLFSLLIFGGCKKDNGKSTNQGKIVFYTNAQAMLNCGSFDETINMDGDSVGTLSEPYVEDVKPSGQESNSFTLVVEKNFGSYTYSAKFNCGQTIGPWGG